jgi:hypothetical protein
VPDIFETRLKEFEIPGLKMIPLCGGHFDPPPPAGELAARAIQTFALVSVFMWQKRYCSSAFYLN